MTSAEFDQKQFEKQSELLKAPKPKTRKEKDIWNLKWIRASIRYGSRYYRYGMIATLDRAIKRLEDETNAEN